MNHENELTAAEQMQAQRQVEAFLAIMQSRYGISPDDLPDMISAVRWATAYRNRIDRLSFHAAMTIVGVVVLGGATILWAGLKSLVSR